MTSVKSSVLSEWLAYLEARHRAPIQLGLPRVKAFAETLDVLTWKNTVVITVAGTNGKGSTVASLKALYAAAGFRVAAYTSPHLLVFNERIQINQTYITDEALCEAFKRIDALDGSEVLTYFEMTTLAALLFFKQQQPDVLLLEVGLGGRLDATNIIDADVAVVTTVDLDHQAWLGETKEAIAYEKAGIFRANKPAIYADEQPPERLVQHAETLHAPLLSLGNNYKFLSDKQHFVFSGEKLPTFELPPISIHPKAFAAAIMVSLTLQDKLQVSEADYQAAAASATLEGRQQWLDTSTPTLLDVAHNPQSVRVLANFLRSHPVDGDIHVVFSGLQDKDLSGLIEPMQDLVHTWHVSLLDDKRAATKAQLNAALLSAMPQDKPQSERIVFEDPLMAYRSAKEATKAGDIVVVYGSFVLISTVMHAYLNQEI